MLGVHKNTLANYEKDSRSPDLDLLIKLLKINPDINPLWLLTGEGRSSKNEEMETVLDHAKKLIEAYTEYIKEESGGYLPPPKLLAQGIVDTLEYFIDLIAGKKISITWDKAEIKRIIKEGH